MVSKKRHISYVSEGAAELGSVGLAQNNDNEKADFYTKPEAVKKFTEATDVDALAIAIGNAHGDYPFPPKLDLERLDEINAITDVPLVLHGGSGIPEDQLAEAFSRATISPAAPEIMPPAVAVRIAGNVIAARQAYGT